MKTNKKLRKEYIKRIRRIVDEVTEVLDKKHEELIIFPTQPLLRDAIDYFVTYKEIGIEKDVKFKVHYEGTST